MTGSTVRPASFGVITRNTGRELVRAVVWRPDLWWTALGVVRRLAAPGWWGSSPHLPLPEHTDLISYLEWCRSTVGPSRLRRLNRSGQGRRHGAGTGGDSTGVSVFPPNRLGQARSG
jgi:hypothetical protein